MAVEQAKEDPWAKPEWYLLSYQKAMTASSCEEGREPSFAADENVQTWWRAAGNQPGEWLAMDLGEVKPEEKSFVVISGANMDFTHLTQIARQAGIGNHETRYLRISMDSKRGQVLKYLRHIPQDTTLVDVQYGKTEGSTQYPVFGIAASDEDLDTIRTTLKKKGIEFEDISEDDDVRFRMIHYQPELCQHPLFVHIEFPERAGAFLDFMERIADLASLCYFNYTYTGERVCKNTVIFPS